MQIWTTYHEDEITEALLTLSKDKVKPAIVVTTKSGEMIAAEKYDAAASHGKNGSIHAFLRIGKIFYGENESYYYDLEHTQLYPEDIKEIAACDRWIPESESPESYLKPGMKVRITRKDFDEVYEGELTVVTFLDVVLKTDKDEFSIPVSKILSMVILQMPASK